MLNLFQDGFAAMAKWFHGALAEHAGRFFTRPARRAPTSLFLRGPVALIRHSWNWPWRRFSTFRNRYGKIKSNFRL
jgi:hypothetical protein